MSSAQWETQDFDDDQASPGRPVPTLVSLHFIRSALRRRWWACVLCAVLGLFAAGSFLMAFPALYTAKTALVLTHDPKDEPSQAMATDVSLLQTRTVAAKTVAELGLTISPDDFLETVTAEPVSSDLLSITLTASSDAEAVRRLGALTSIYLDFRGQQLSMQSNLYVQGIQQRIAELEGQLGPLSKRIERLSAGGSQSASKLSDTISQRAFIQGRIDTLQQQVEDVTLQTRSIVSSSRVVDPAAPEPHAANRRIALALASGLIGGAAVGCGTVLFFAITSDRLRRRSDVAAALGVAVPISVGRIAPLSKHMLWLPHMRTIDGRRAEARQRLARAIELELPMPRRLGRLAVVCIDNAEEVGFAVAAAATELVASGYSVVIIDLTTQGSVDLKMVHSITGSTHGPTVLRPSGVPTLASDVADLRAVDDKNEVAPSLELTDITLVLADIDPSVGADHLVTWSSRVIIAVTAGRTSAEMLNTAADLVRDARLELRFAALLHAERADDSSGTAGFERAPLHPVNSQETGLVEKSIVEEQGTAEKAATDNGDLGTHVEPIAVEGELGEEEQVISDQHDQPTALPHWTAEEQIDDWERAAEEDQAAALQQPTNEDQGTAEKQAATDNAELRALVEPIAVEGELGEEEQVISDQHDQPTALPHWTAEEQIDDWERAAKEDQAAALQQPTNEDQGTAEKQAATDNAELRALVEPIAFEEELGDEEQVISDQHEQPKPLPHWTAEEQIDDRERAAKEDQAAALQQPTNEEQIVAEHVLDERTLDEAIGEELTTSARHDQAIIEEQPADEEQLDAEERANKQLSFIEYSLVRLGPSPQDDSASIDADDHVGQLRPNDVDNPAPAEVAVDSWPLYGDDSPAGYGASVRSSEEYEHNSDLDWDEVNAESDQESTIIRAHDDAAWPHEDLTTPGNGSQNNPASEVKAEADSRDGTVRRAADSQADNGSGHQKTSTRRRRRNSRPIK